MKVTLIYHSGFLVETGEAYFLFDWFTGAIPPMLPGNPLFVFVSHAHGDHFSRKIFDLPADRFILSDDISMISCPHTADIRDKIIRLGAHEAAELPLAETGDFLTIKTLKSNDLGIAFVLSTPEGSIYHAGDLNNWWWDGDAEDKALEKSCHDELERIKGMHFAVAMIPYDLRLKEPGRGIGDFLKYCTADRIYGMHLNGSRTEGLQRLASDPILRDTVIL